MARCPGIAAIAAAILTVAALSFAAEARSSGGYSRPSLSAGSRSTSFGPSHYFTTIGALAAQFLAGSLRKARTDGTIRQHRPRHHHGVAGSMPKAIRSSGDIGMVKKIESYPELADPQLLAAACTSLEENGRRSKECVSATAS